MQLHIIKYFPSTTWESKLPAGSFLVLRINQTFVHKNSQQIFIQLKYFIRLNVSFAISSLKRLAIQLMWAISFPMFKLIKIIVTILFAFSTWMFYGISSVDFAEMMATLQYTSKGMRSSDWKPSLLYTFIRNCFVNINVSWVVLICFIFFSFLSENISWFYRKFTNYLIKLILPPDLSQIECSQIFWL